MTDIQARLREPIIADAEEKGHITSVFLAERLILERGEAADEIARLTEEVHGLKLQVVNYRLSGLDGDLQAKADALAEAAEQCLDDMGEKGKSVAQVTKEWLQSAFTSYRGKGK